MTVVGGQEVAVGMNLERMQEKVDAINQTHAQAVSAAVREFAEKAENGLEALRAGEFQYIPDGRWAIDEAIKLLKSMSQEVK